MMVLFDGGGAAIETESAENVVAADDGRDRICDEHGRNKSFKVLMALSGLSPDFFF